VEISETCEVKRDFFFQLPHKHKRYVLNINSHLDQSIEGGIMGLKRLWFADYLERPSTQDEEDNNTAQVDVIFRIIRRTEVLNQHFGQQKMFEYQHITGGKATHLVEKVVYGAELIVSMRRALDLNFESKSSAEGNMYLAAKAFFQQMIDSKVYHGERPTELDKINCTIFSSIDPGNVKNGTFEDSCKVIKDAVCSTNEEKWKPIEITLKDIPAQIEARIWSEKTNDVDCEKERQLTMLKAITKESNLISKHPSINRVPPIEKVMCQFIDLLAPFRKEIQSFHSLFTVERRAPEQFLSDMKPISDLLIGMTDWLMHRRKEIEIMCSLLSDTKLPMTDLEEIKNSVSSGKEKRTRVFILKMDCSPDPLIENLAKYIGNQKPFKLPVFLIATSGKRWIEPLIRTLKVFDDLKTRWSSLDYSCQIGLVPISSTLEEGTIIPIECSINPIAEDTATELPQRSIQPSGNSQESQLPISDPDNSMLFPHVKTSFAPTVFNMQKLCTPQPMMSKNLVPIKCFQLPTNQDSTKGENFTKKEPMMTTSSTTAQIQSETSLGLFDSTEDAKCGVHSTSITPTTSTAYVRKKLFESIKDNDSMKQTSKPGPFAEIHIEEDVTEPNVNKGKSQPTKEHVGRLFVAARIENYEKSRKESIDEENKNPCGATSSIKPDAPAQENSSNCPESAVHQQDLNRQQIEAQNKDKICEKIIVSDETAVKTGRVAEKFARETNEYAKLIKNSSDQERLFHQPTYCDKETVCGATGRVAEIFAQEANQYAKLIKEGQPSVYLLNANENSVNKDFRWFNIDKPGAPSIPEDNRDHKVIILMGATGCGKSTLINGMVNYILGVQWNDPYRFKCVREDEKATRNQALSQTSSVTAYTLRHHEGMAVPYSITIIDTPGYGDTSGVQRDKLITDNIHQFLTQQETRVDEIHAACFVAASGDSRLTATQRYIIDSVLSIFGKDVKPNMRLLVTFADNADPPVVEACLAAQFPVTSASAGITYSKFNSSVLYASNEKHGEDDLCFDELFWDMGQENFYKFFAMLEGMNGQNLKSTRDVIQRRQQLVQSIKEIESELEASLSTIEEMEKIRQKLRECSHNMEANKNFVVEKTEMRNVEVKCEKGFSAYNCNRCKKTCEKPEKIKKFEKKLCTDKDCYCPAHFHVYQQFAWVPTSAKLTTTLRDMKAEFEANFKQKLTNEDFMTNCLDELNMAKGTVLSLLEQVGTNARSLNSTALRSNALNPAEYLSLMKSRVLEEQAPGYLTRLQTLTELQESLNAPAVLSTTTKTDKSTPVQPNNNQPEKKTRSCGRGRGILGRDTISTVNPGTSQSTPSSSTQKMTQGTKIDGGVGRERDRNIPSTQGNSLGSQVRHPPGEPENYYKISKKASKTCQTKEPDTGSSTNQSTFSVSVMNAESNPASDPKVISSYPLESKAGYSSEEEVEQRNKKPEESKNPVVSFLRKYWSSK
jgi:GTP-binding protein EngB required for normal cell division